jgi:hypothetical protein
MKKICRDCGVEKEIDSFYKHKKMKDGHLNKCKECVKKRIHNYWTDGRGVAVDKKRQQKEKRKEWCRVYSKKMRVKFALKRKVLSVWWEWFKKNKGVRTNCEVCGSNKNIEAHHSDYNKPYDVKWLCCYHHKEWHKNNNPILPSK